MPEVAFLYYHSAVAPVISSGLVDLQSICCDYLEAAAVGSAHVGVSHLAVNEVVTLGFLVTIALLGW